MVRMTYGIQDIVTGKDMAAHSGVIGGSMPGWIHVASAYATDTVFFYKV
ncbi:hypothetical protein [Komagataeibacter saccharivorans]|nr:hypothetical protein [Komagataeibacter saccharivorans]